MDLIALLPMGRSGAAAVLRRLVLGVGILCPMVPDTYMAQPVVTPLAPDATCACRLVMHREVEIGETRAGLPITPGTRVEADPRGGLLLWSLEQMGLAVRLDASGLRFATLGGAGSGAQTIGRIRDVARVSADSFLVVDAMRLTVLDSSGVPARSRNLPDRARGFRFLGLSDGRIVINNYMPDRPSFLLLDRNLDEVRQFGPHTPASKPMDSDAIQYQLADLGNGRFAAVRQNYDYVVEVWDTTGTRVQQFRRTTSWFRPWTFEDALSRGPRSPPFTRVEGVHFEPPNRLWVIATVPDRRLPVAPRRVQNSVRGREVPDWTPLPVSEYSRTYDTIIEVVDIASGKPLITQRFDEYLSSSLGDGRLASLRETARGVLVLDVWRVSVESVPPRAPPGSAALSGGFVP